MKISQLAMVAALVVGTFGTPALAQDAAIQFDRSAEIEAAIAGGDVKKGESVFAKCKACHKIGDGAKNAVGPQLNNFFGNELGSSEGFKYSDPLLEKKAAGQVWDIEALNAFLLKPKDYIPKTKMTFAGLKKDADRANVIAFLASIQAAE